MKMNKSAKNRIKVKSLRSQKGATSAVLMLALLLGILLYDAFNVDFSRLVMARTQLQNAVDIGARDGAYELLVAPGDAEATAKAFAAQNYSSGEKVDESVPGTTVTVVVDSVSAKPSVTVTATKEYKHMWAGLFAGFGSKSALTCMAKAQVEPALTTINANQLFPMAITKNIWAGGAPYVGMQLELAINSQQYKNAAWAQTNKNDLDLAMRIALGLDTADIGDNEISSLSVGDQIPLNNGLTGQMGLTKPNSEIGQALLTKDIVVPVIEGDPAFNQTRKVVGFLVIRVTQIIKGGGQGGNPGQPLTLMATVTKGLFHGTFNTGTNGETVDSSLTGVGAAGVKLVQ